LEVLAKKMALSLDTILGSAVPGGCACEKKRDCALWWGCRGGSTTVKSLTARSQPGVGRPSAGNREDRDDIEEKEIDREPFKVMLMNALNPGVVSANANGGVNGHGGGENTGGWRGRKKGGGHGRKWPELGPLIGFERGWIVKEDLNAMTTEPRHHRRVEQEDSEEEMNVDNEETPRPQDLDLEFDSPLSELAELEPETMEVDEEKKLELDGLTVGGEFSLCVVPFRSLSG
jgi:hypothetical protein